MEGAGVCGDGGEEIGGDVRGEGEAGCGDELEEDLAGGGGCGIDVGEVAVGFVADVVIDVDPEFGGFDGGEGGA